MANKPTGSFVVRSEGTDLTIECVDAEGKPTGHKFLMSWITACKLRADLDFELTVAISKVRKPK